ncbi:N-acetyltransferase [Salmonella enterica]|nr:N-acetyltransferase [Salmonella enterica]
MLFQKEFKKRDHWEIYKAVDGHRACFFYIFENGNEKIGFSSVIEHSPVTFEIWLMVIEKQYRRNGYGKIIVKNIIKKHIIPFTENLFFVRTYKSSTTMISLLNNLKFRSHTNEGADNVIFTKIYSEKDLQ